MGLALLSIPATAATLQRLELDEMIQKSTGIVRGRVADTGARLHGSVIYTHYRVQVLENWKGAEAVELDVVIPGGIANGLRQVFPGAPRLEAGKEYVLFLWTGASGLTNIIGLSQGVFDVHRDIAGGVFAARAATSETMLDADGRLVRDEAVRMRFEELRGRIRTLAARGAQR
jgi:hypothetical protein